MDEKLFLAIMVIRLIYAGIHILTKEAFNGGMNTSVFVFYRQAAATIFLLPVAIIFERRRVPSASLTVLFKMFLLALFGIAISLNTSSLGIRYTSASLSAATENTIPIITFILAVLFRMEDIRLMKLSGVIKVQGLALFLAGIVTIAFYRGPQMKSVNHHHLFVKKHSNSTDHSHDDSSSSRWMIGCFLMLVANIEWCLWIVLQGSLLKKLPSKLLFTTVQVVFSAFQAFVIALIRVRDFSQWKIGFDVQLLSVAYCGILVTGVSFYLQTWCIDRAGPVLVAMTTPLSLVITVVILSFILGETIELGSVLGGVLMVAGLYSVMLGKGMEATESNESMSVNNEECLGENVMATPNCSSGDKLEPTAHRIQEP